MVAIDLAKNARTRGVPGLEMILESCSSSSRLRLAAQWRQVCEVCRDVVDWRQ